MVAQGKIRWIVVSSSGNTGMSDGRAGSTAAMAAAAQVGKAVSSVDGLYDLQGTADALARYVTLKPPSTSTIVPVIQPARSDASQAIAAATSSASPSRRSG